MSHRQHVQLHGEIRRGVLYMILAGVIQYFAGGYSTMEIPFQVPSAVTTILLPMLFLSGLAFVVYGLYLRARA